MRGLVTSGTYAVGDPALQFSGDWETQVLGGQEYRLAHEDARLRIDFSGSRISVLARGSVDGGRLFATLDGRPVPGLRSAGGRTYISLSAERTGDTSVLVANGLPPGQHTLELTAGAEGVVAVAGVAVASERPAGWAFRWLHGVLLLALWLSLWLTLRQALRAAGYLPATPLAALLRRRAWR
jgi:hypothetical protein